MKRFPRPVQAYIVLVIVAGGAGALLELPKRMEFPDAVLFVALALPGILAGMRSLPLVYSHLRINLTGGILLMAVFLATPQVATLLSAVIALVSGLALRRRLWNVLFMSGANVLSVGLAAELYDELAVKGALPLDSPHSVVALFISSSAYWIANSALVTVLVAARNDEMVLRTYITTWHEVYLQCILLTLLAVLGTAAWHQGILYAVLLIVPTIAVYQLLSITREKQEQVTRAIQIIAEVLDRRNPFTFQHSKRVAEHVVRIARQLNLSPVDAEVLRRAALVHDIGKLGVDDPSHEMPLGGNELTDYQFYSLKQHAQLGAMMAREIPAFEEAEEAIRYHHDWYDGTHVSKPHSQEDIPLGARIIAVADSYDLLCMSNGEASLICDPIAVEQLRKMGGRQLDPELLATFLSLLQTEQEAKPVPAAARRAVAT